ncbi:MAG TPA: ABC transporter substrate-binding protein [Gaiellaceae bacterium]|nr:ABC transporter substrate-binding protein [Gaiellaceae bacterium]
MSDESPPTFELEQLASRQLTRRSLFAAAGAGGLAAALGTTTARAAARPARLARVAAGTVSFGSNASDPVPKKAFQQVFAAFTKKTGTKVSVNTVDHNTFQEQINTYLQGRPQDVFTWFAGYRMQFFAQKGLLSPIDDVWATLKPNFSPAMQAASKGLDGHFYFVPIYNYPWAVFYRKSLFKANGYTVPKTWDQFLALAKQMQADGLTPIAFTDKDGWPAMGTFDILNMRINGYQFHVRLMAGKESWNSPQVKSVFNHWRQLLPYYSQGALGLTWEEGAQQMITKKAGMFLLGSFVGQQATNPADHADLDFFPYPEINPKWGQDSIDAPIDGFLMARKAKNTAGAKQLLTFLGSATAENIYLKSDSNDVAANKLASTAHYNALQKKSAQLIASVKHIAQYMDRDTRPDFASTVMIPALQQFLNTPTDVNGLVSSIQKQKKSIFGF